MEAVSIEGDMLTLRGREEADLSEAEGVEDLGAESVTAKIHMDGFKGAGAVIGICLLWDLQAGAGLGHVDESALTLLCDTLEREVDAAFLSGCMAIKYIAEDIFGLDADESGLLVELTHGEGEMDAVIGQGAEQVQGPVPVGVGKRLGEQGLDKFLAIVAVLDQLLDGDELEAELLAELDQFREACHGSVLIEDFTKDPGWGKAGEYGEINGRLGMPGALQDAARARAQGEDMAWLDKLVGGGFGIGDDPDGLAAIGGTDAGGDALGGIDGHGEVGAMAFAVIGDHRIEAEALELMFHGGNANQAAAMPDHHVDGLRRGGGGGHDQVALIFTIFVIGDDNQFAGGDIINGRLNGIKRIFWHGVGLEVKCLTGQLARCGGIEY